MRAQAKDEADIASEQEEHFRQEAIFNSTKPLRYQHRGRCYNCDEPSRDRFCDVDCRKDFEREQRVRQSQQAQQRRGGERPQAD